MRRRGGASGSGLDALRPVGAVDNLTGGDGDGHWHGSHEDEPPIWARWIARLGYDDETILAGLGEIPAGGF